LKSSVEGAVGDTSASVEIDASRTRSVSIGTDRVSPPMTAAVTSPWGTYILTVADDEDVPAEAVSVTL
jgi:hypothetical protein